MVSWILAVIGTVAAYVWDALKTVTQLAWTIVSFVVSTFFSMVSLTFQALPVPLKMFFGFLIASVVLIPAVNLSVGAGNQCTADGVLEERNPIWGILSDGTKLALSVDDKMKNDPDKPIFTDIISHNYLVVPNGYNKDAIFYNSFGKPCSWQKQTLIGADMCEQNLLICKKASDGQCYMKYLTSRSVNAESCYNGCVVTTRKILFWTTTKYEQCSNKDDVIQWLTYVVTPTNEPELKLIKSFMLPNEKPTNDWTEDVVVGCPLEPDTPSDQLGSYLYLENTNNKVWIFDSYRYDFVDLIADRFSTTFKPTESAKGSSEYVAFINEQVLPSHPELDTSDLIFKHSSQMDGIVQKEIGWGGVFGLSCDLQDRSNPDVGYSVGIQVWGIRDVFTWSTFVGMFVLFIVFSLIGFVSKHS